MKKEEQIVKAKRWRSKEGSRKEKRREVVRSREERSGVVELVNNPIRVGLLEGQGWRMK